MVFGRCIEATACAPSGMYRINGVRVRQSLSPHGFGRTSEICTLWAMYRPRWGNLSEVTVFEAHKHFVGMATSTTLGCMLGKTSAAIAKVCVPTPVLIFIVPLNLPRVRCFMCPIIFPNLLCCHTHTLDHIPIHVPPPTSIHKISFGREILLRIQATRSSLDRTLICFSRSCSECFGVYATPIRFNKLLIRPFSVPRSALAEMCSKAACGPRSWREPLC